MSKALRIAALFVIASAACAHTAAVVLDHTPKPHHPTLVLRASRMIALTGQPILLTAALDGGDEVESYYCPTVVWTWPDGTESGEGGDCAPFEQRAEYPRTWTHWTGLAVAGATYPISVRLEKAGHVVARATVELTAAGGEQ